MFLRRWWILENTGGAGDKRYTRHGFDKPLGTADIVEAALPVHVLDPATGEGKDLLILSQMDSHRQTRGPRGVRNAFEAWWHELGIWCKLGTCIIKPGDR